MLFVGFLHDLPFEKSDASIKVPHQSSGSMCQQLPKMEVDGSEELHFQSDDF